jgi:peptidoglycan-associated lipoprotein
MIPLVLLLILVLPIAVSCKKKPPADSDQPPAPAPTEQATPAPSEEPTRQDVTDPFQGEDVDRQEIDEEQTAAYWNRNMIMQTVFFGFDSSELTDQARDSLQRNATWLRNNDAFNLAIGGHCDERGTIEYNLALGQRRANIVRDYLVSLGVEVERMRVVSYGEEKPVDAGRTESAWSKNRRADFELED